MSQAGQTPGKHSLLSLVLRQVRLFFFSFLSINYSLSSSSSFMIIIMIIIIIIIIILEATELWPQQDFEYLTNISTKT